MALSKRACVLIPGIWEYVTSHGKRSFANVIKDLEARDYPRLPGWVQCNHEGLCKREARWEGSKSEM